MSTWNDARRQLASLTVTAETDEVINEVNQIEEQEAARNAMLKQQLEALKASRGKQIAEEHTASLKTMEKMFQRQTEDLEAMVDGRGASVPEPVRREKTKGPCTSCAALRDALRASQDEVTRLRQLLSKSRDASVLHSYSQSAVRHLETSPSRSKSRSLSPVHSEHLRITNRRLKQELATMHSQDRLVTKRIQQLARTAGGDKKPPFRYG